MAFSQLFVCDTCDHDEVLVHADEWQRGTAGEILPYPGQGPIGGLVNRLWCPHCRMVRPYAFVILNPPGAHAVVAYAEAQQRGCDGNETGPCPQCDTLLTWQLDGAACAACPNGTFRFMGQWEDAI